MSTETETIENENLNSDEAEVKPAKKRKTEPVTEAPSHTEVRNKNNEEQPVRSRDDFWCGFSPDDVMITTLNHPNIQRMVLEIQVYHFGSKETAKVAVKNGREENYPAALKEALNLLRGYVTASKKK